MNKAEILYRDIGDYFSHVEKMKIVSEGSSIFNSDLKMSMLKPNEHGDWINKRNSRFDEFIPMEFIRCLVFEKRYALNLDPPDNLDVYCGPG